MRASSSDLSSWLVSAAVGTGGLERRSNTICGEPTDFGLQTLETGDFVEAVAGGLLRRIKSDRLLPICKVRSTVTLAGRVRRSKFAEDVVVVGEGNGCGGELVCSGVLGRDGLKRRSKFVELLAAAAGADLRKVLDLGVEQPFDSAATFADLDLAADSSASFEVLGSDSLGVSEESAMTIISLLSSCE